MRKTGRVKGSKNGQVKLDPRELQNRHHYVGGHENRGWKFTPAHWAQWMADRQALPDAKSVRLAAGIDEFRSILNK